MKKISYQFTRSNWKNERMICWGINEERLEDEDYDTTQYAGAFDDFDTFDIDFIDEF